uniref:Uncharacterized protein n=1 Tax=Populus alba TaxID=43335 RepID=A0A4V6ABU7_POPAL|nr:hypothetical protein D5086_0000024650 [Populus alba]
MTNLILEFASAVFDQLGYASIGMVLAFVALLLATAELIYMARKEKMSLLPCFHRPSTGTSAPGEPVGTIVEYFGLVGAVWQCFYSIVDSISILVFNILQFLAVPTPREPMTIDL